MAMGKTIETCSLGTLHVCAWVRALHHWMTWWSMVYKTVKDDEVFSRMNNQKRW
jgi:hypothetical protein